MRKILGLICIAGSIALGVAMFKQQTNNSSSDQKAKFTRHSAPVVLLGLGLRLLFSGGGGATVLPLPRRNTNRQLPPGHPAWRGGQDTFATNPAQLELHFTQWLAANPGHIILLGTLTGAALILLLIKWPVALALLGVTAFVLWRTRQEISQKFLSGDVCPGVVLSAAKGWVAVLTDLKAATNVDRLAIKVLKQPLHRIKVYALQDGMRVAAVAQYSGDAQETAWKDFSPEVIPCVVHDEAENQRILESVPEAQWLALDQHLAQIPNPRPGLYRLWGGQLAAAESGAGPWLQRRWVQISLIAFACCGLLLIGLVAWGARSANRTRTNPQHDYPRPTTTATVPKTQQSIDLSGQVLTFTNSGGVVFKEIELVQANPAFLQYRTQGRNAFMALATIPGPVQDALGIPPDWHGYRAATMAAETKAAPPNSPETAMTTTRTAAYRPGQKIYAQWAGAWIPGTIIEPVGMGMAFRLQLEDARFRYPMVLTTNLLRAR